MSNFHPRTRLTDNSNYESRSRFQVVEFDEGHGKRKTVELVPSEWISKDHNNKLFCKWPDQTTGLSSLRKLVKFKNTESLHITWKSYPARLIGEECGKLINYSNESYYVHCVL